SRTINDELSRVNTPSVKTLQELKFSVLESKLFLETWWKALKPHPDKERLIEFRNKEYLEKKKELTKLSQLWSHDQQDSLMSLFSSIDELFVQQSIDVIDPLQTFDDYQDDPFAVLNAQTS